MTNLARKAFHLSGVVIVLVYLRSGMDRSLVAGLLGAIVLLLALLDLLRYRNPAIQERFRAMFGAILDQKDFKGPNGSTLYFLGCALAVAIYPQREACGGILALAIGDPMAAVVGSSVRSPRYGRVSMAGSLACFAFATVGCATLFPLPKALTAGLVAAVVEALSSSKLDNLSLPLGVGMALRLL